MKEFTTYWSNGGEKDGNQVSFFFPEDESQFIVTNIVAKSGQDDLRMYTAYEKILGFEPMKTTQIIASGSNKVMLNTITTYYGEDLKAGDMVYIGSSLPYFGLLSTIQSIDPVTFELQLNDNNDQFPIPAGSILYLMNGGTRIPMAKVSNNPEEFMLNIQGDGLAASSPSNPLLFILYGSYGTDTSIFVSGYYDDID